MPDDDRYRLGDLDFFASLRPRALRTLEKECFWRSYRAHQLIFDHTDTSGDVFFVAEGSVRIVNYARSGREIAFDHVEAGGYFGELAAIDGEGRSAVAVAGERCVLAGIPALAFVDVLRRCPAHALDVMRRLATIVRTADDRIVDLSTLRAEKRVCLQLMRAAVPNPDKTAGGLTISPPLSHTRLASSVSTTRETVMRVFRHLEAARIIERDHETHAVTILDPGGLDALINTGFPDDDEERGASEPR